MAGDNEARLTAQKHFRETPAALHLQIAFTGIDVDQARHEKYLDHQREKVAINTANHVIAAGNIQFWKGVMQILVGNATVAPAGTGDAGEAAAHGAGTRDAFAHGADIADDEWFAAGSYPSPGSYRSPRSYPSAGSYPSAEPAACGCSLAPATHSR